MFTNRWKMICLAIVGATLAVWSLPDQPLDAQDKKPATDSKPAAAPNPLQPFAGKIVLVQKKHDTSPQIISSVNVFSGFGGYVMDNPSLVQIGGVHWLAGYGIERVDNQPVGPRILLAFAEISTILEFNNVDDYKAYEEQQIEKLRHSEMFEMAVPAVPLGMPIPAEDGPDA
jgi:hypothetical protein